MVTEVDKKILQRKNKGLIYRFFMDAKNRMYLHLWQNAQKEKDPESNFGIERFQLSNDQWAFEWAKDSVLKCAQISEDHDPSKIKPSPLMLMQSQIDQDSFLVFQKYLKMISPKEVPEAAFISNIFKKRKRLL